MEKPKNLKEILEGIEDFRQKNSVEHKLIVTPSTSCNLSMPHYNMVITGSKFFAVAKPP